MGRPVIRELAIRNFVLIEDLRLALEPQLNVLTGETGAGKSIVLDALSLLAGGRFETSSIRQGAERCAVDGVYDAPKTKSFKRWWSEHGFDASDELVIRREGYPDGRSKAWLNDRPVTLATLQELASFLIDVHGQHEHQTILKPSVQLSLLDQLANLEETVAKIEPLYDRWKTLVQEQSSGQLSEQDRMQRLDLLRFQKDEISGAKLKTREDETLAQRMPELKNAERLQVFASTAYTALTDAEDSAADRLGQALKAMESLAGLAPAAEPLYVELKQAAASVQQIASALQEVSERWTSDPGALEDLLNRLDKIDRLKKKYGGTVDAVLAHEGRVTQELDRLENADTTGQDLEKQRTAAEQALDKACGDVSRKRTKAAAELGTAVAKHLGDLGLKQAIFRCTLEKTAPGPTGADRVVFEWSPNPGEGIQPLKAIVSGGEMSRVMLALKTVLAQADSVPTLVFDEVDAGIGGLTAQAVGKKLRRLAQHHQVLCVSHLPQIASCAQAHFQVSKRTQHSRTFATVIRLDSEARLSELARLLGSQVTPTSLQHARELLEHNQ